MIRKFFYQKPNYQNLWNTVNLKNGLLSCIIKKLAVPKLNSGLNQLDWRIVWNMLEVIF